MPRILNGLVILASLIPALLEGRTPYASYMTQSPEIKAPEQGSLAGAAAKFVANPTSLSQGAISIPLGLTFDQARGPLLNDFQPSYSPQNGISEWGMGWSNSLSISRYRETGVLTFDDGDEWQSPYGPLKRGSDGFWYPKGLRSKVRVQFQADEVVAYLEDGSQAKFQEKELGAGTGIYAYHLTEVKNAKGQLSLYRYEKNTSGRLFLVEVKYGGYERAALPYTITLAYEKLPTTHMYLSYASYRSKLLDRRVSQVDFASRDQLRWSYVLTHELRSTNTAPYLTSVQRVFKSGAKEPASNYSYGNYESHLAGMRPESVNTLNDVLQNIGFTGLQADRVTFFDYDQDGLSDVEISKNQNLYRQTETGFVKLETEPGQASNLCRPAASDSNPARKILRLQGSYSENRVLSLTANGANTRMFICSMEGKLLHQQSFTTDLTDAAFTRVVDINRDNRPDIMRFVSGGYVLIENQSTSEQLSFVEKGRFTLPQNFQPASYTVTDVNGDSILDLIGTAGTGFQVVFGSAPGQFVPQVLGYKVTDIAGNAFSTEGYDPTFMDANGDGVADLVLTKGQDFFLFLNTERQFKQINFPARESLVSEGDVHVGNIKGSGEPMIFRTDGKGGVRALMLSRAETGLLTEWNDGMGSVVRLKYGYNRPAARQISLHRVVTEMSRQSVGLGSYQAQFSYEDPAHHAETSTLLGFGKVVVVDEKSITSQSFQNEHFSAGVPLETRLSDRRIPGIIQYKSLKYQSELYRDIQHLLLQSETQGKIGDGGQSSVTTKIFSDYNDNLCARRIESRRGLDILQQVLTISVPSALSLHMICRTEKESMVGLHANKDFDFRHDVRISYNEIGQPTKVALVDGTSLQELQAVQYDSYFRPYEFKDAAGLVQTTVFEGDTDLVKLIRNNIGLVSEIRERDASDKPLTIRKTQGIPSVWDRFFRYDGHERLHKSWDNIEKSSEDSPLTKIEYAFPLLDIPAQVTVGVWESQAQRFHHKQIWTAADGSEIAKLEELPLGWVARDVKLYKTGIDRVDSFAMQTIAGPERSSWQNLFNATLLQSTTKSAWGGDLENSKLYQAGKIERQKALYSLTEGLFKIESIQNAKYSQISLLDGEGNRVASIDATGARTDFAYDMLGRLTSVGFADGKTHNFDYDNLARLKKVTRSEVGSIVYTYNQQNLVESKEHYGVDGQLDRKEMNRYDGFGRLIKTTFKKGIGQEEISFIWDGLTENGQRNPDQVGQLTHIKGPGFTLARIYNLRGQLTQNGSIYRGGQISHYRDMQYDHLGRKTEESITFRDNSINKYLSYVLGWEYSGYGRLDHLKLNGKVLVTENIDALGRLMKAETSDSNLIPFYDEITQSNRGYDFKKPDAALSYRYDWSDRGLIESEVFNLGNQTRQRTFAYDSRGFLETQLDNGREDSFRYDSVGLIKKISDSRGSRDIVRAGSVITAGGLVYRFDQLGRIVQKSDGMFYWGSRGQLERYAAKGYQWTYVYDLDGLPLYTEKDGNLIRASFGSDDYTEAKLSQDVRSSQGALLGWLRDGQFTPSAADLRDSPILSSKNELSVIDPYGFRIITTGFENLLDFAGHSRHEEHGLVRMGVRYYDDMMGTFVSPDPWFLEHPSRCSESPVECNLYSYAGNSPLVWHDPTGKFRMRIPFSDKYVYVQKDPDGGYKAGVTTKEEGFYIDPAPDGLLAEQKITFNNDNPQNPTTNQKVSLELAETIEGAVRDTGFKVNINSTTGGHGTSGLHPKGLAADINVINGKAVLERGADADVRKFHNSLTEQKYTRNVLSPVARVQVGQLNSASTAIVPIQTLPHRDHVHAGAWTAEQKQPR